MPLGGGAAVFEMLRDEWLLTQPFELQAITPSSVSGGALAAYTEMQYARFCRAFEQESTDRILREDPARTAVLANDISEGPGFRRLAEHGFRVFTIFHVDVVAYVAAIYGGNLFSPKLLVALHKRFGRLYPDVAKLVFEKQRDCVECSRGLIVPSPAMKELLMWCYPALDPARVHVLPWGAPPPHPERADPMELRREFGIPESAIVLLCLSRIAPEKGQDLLLASLPFLKTPVHAVICGEAAFMKGQSYLRKLLNYRGVNIHFPGYVTGSRKRGFFGMADLYVFPSRHESYGLTLMEAFAEGLPAITTGHSGALAVMRPEFGEVVRSRSPQAFAAAIDLLLEDRARLRGMGERARRYAMENPFRAAAARLAEIIVGNEGNH